MYLGAKAKPEKSPKREYYGIKVYGPDGNVTEEIHPERGIKHVFEFVDGFLSMKEVVIDKRRKKAGFRTSAIGDPEDMEKPLKRIKPDERFITRYDDEYDNEGRRNLRRIFFSDGEMNSITRYIYNHAGRLEKEIYNTYGNKWTYIYSYDADGNLIERLARRSDSGDVVGMTERMKYSDYKFDAHGNWIERKYSYDEESNLAKPISNGVDYRDIKYYGEEDPKKKTKGRGKK